ncbi:MAG: UPF0182 family protein [Gemmatimonadota bacterium]
MSRRGGRTVLIAAIVILLLLVLSRVAVEFYTDVLWYDGVGYLSTFWRRFALGFGVRTVAAAVAAVLVFVNLWWVARHLGPVRVRRRYGNIEIAEQVPSKYVLGIAAGIAILGGWWLAELQFDGDAVLVVAGWLRRVSWDVPDPLFGRDISFYLFSLPLATRVLEYLILIVVWSMAVVALGHVLVGGVEWAENRVSMTGDARRHLGLLLAIMLMVLAVRFWVGRYHLVVEGNGVAGALGFSDVEARIPAAWTLAMLSLAAAGALIYGAWRAVLLPPVVALGVLLVGGPLVGEAYPALVQKFQVEPNELRRETPYIEWNLAFTRRAYGLDDLSRHAFPYDASAEPGPGAGLVLARVPLWDPEPLEQAFNEIQTLFPYYWFPDVDYNRYGPAGTETQVALAVREFRPSGLDEGDRTWQSLRLNPAYLRGLGAVVAPTGSREGAYGAPELWVRNVNPVVMDPEAPAAVALERPEVFIGETMRDYVVLVPGRDGAFTGEAGVDFPRGVRLSSFARILSFAWRFADEALLLSGEVSPDGRLVFRRTVAERVEALAPFLLWDPDARPVIVDGRVVWLVDGYTVSDGFPLSSEVVLGRRQARYLRPSVKAVVDGVTGEVDLHAVADDPVLETYRRVFPDLIQPLDAMPASVRRHMIYPELALQVQSEVLLRYHLQRPEPFYAGQDVWQRPQEVAPGGGTREVGPVYGLLPVPGAGNVEFLAAMPFIARGRQNLTGLLVVRNDGPGYGALTLYEFPRDQQVPGPGQVQAVIEQDPVIASELSLLRQRGSDVDMGRVRILALDSVVVYMQPLFLSAEEVPIPELWRVVVSDGRNVAMAATLDDALAALAERTGPRDRPAAQPAGRGGWPDEALDLLEMAERRLRAGDWAGYGRVLDELRALLQGLSEEPRGGGEP